jgi:thiol-disulfide isomerase/thioredoxin
MKRTLAAPLLMIAVSAIFYSVHAQSPTKAETFTDVKGVKHTPLDTKDAKAVVLIFLTHDCPVANYYATEINAIVKDHAAKPVRFFLIHVDADLTPAAAQKHAQTYGYTCPVLVDAKHRLVKATGATVTPEAAVVAGDGKVVYLGRIDDIYVELGKRRVEPNRRDLREALAAVLAGKAVAEPRTKAIGCFIPELR